MNHHKTQIVNKAAEIVTEIFQKRVNPLFVFHDLKHTEQVVNAAEEMGKYYKLNEDDQFVLFVSAWFQDTGFSCGRLEEHERESIRLAKEFLYEHKISQEHIDNISFCIQATRLPQEPQNLVGEIMCDADLYHLGTNMFCNRSSLLRHEMQAYHQFSFSEEQWTGFTLEFLKCHKYFTGYCKTKLEETKQNWIELLQNKQCTIE